MVRIISFIWVAGPLTVGAAVFDFGLQGKAGAGLLPGNEVATVMPVSSGSGSASGPIQYDNVNNHLTFDISFQNLTSGAQTAIIKGPATMTAPDSSTVPVLYDLTAGYLSGAGGTAGSVASPGIGGTLTLVPNPNGASSYSIAQQEADLSAGLWFIEITTSNYPFGEIRGNLVPVPEPETYAALVAVGLVGFAFARKLRGIPFSNCAPR